MNARFLFLALFSTVYSCLSAKVIYVKTGANGNGSSWTNATWNLQSALQTAEAGDEIWVAKGVYYPTISTDRTISFQLKAGVALYGGFAGTESRLGDRIIKANNTVLSGEIGTTQKTDNTLNVLFIAHATQTTIVDGFIITGGYAGGDEASSSRFASGGGLYNDGAGRGNESNPVVRNCRFIENTARDGGAIYNNAANGGRCHATYINCTFQDNKAFLGGGAIFNNVGQAGNCSTTINHTIFTRNVAGFGGAIFNHGKDGQCSNQIQATSFLHNQAMIQGGGIFNYGASRTDLTKCKFTENKAPKGSTVANNQAVAKQNTNKAKI